MYITAIEYTGKEEPRDESSSKKVYKQIHKWIGETLKKHAAKGNKNSH